MNCFTMTAEISKPPKKLTIFSPKEVDITRSSYIMAAIDRVVHHSVILDMMEVQSYRATEANHQHLHQQEETQTFSKEEPLAESEKIIVTTGKNYGSSPK